MRLEDEIKQKEFKTDFEKGLINILYTNNWIESRLKEFFKSYNLTSQQFNILRILRGQHPNPSTINLLKERMLDKMCDASRIVERLRVKNLLIRKQCPDDRRSVDILISPQGLELLSKIDGKIEKDFFSLFKQLSPEEMQQLNFLLDKLRG